MRKLLITISLFTSIGGFSQTVSSTSTKSKQTSITSVSSDDVSSKSSISRSSGSYDFDARFDKKKYEAVKELIIDQLGTSYLQVKGRTHVWNKERSGREFFSCQLTNTELHLTLNTEVASSNFYDEIDMLGDDLRDLIQIHDSNTWLPIPPQTPYNPNSRDPQLGRDELRQAELELERAQRNLERLKKKKN